MRLEEHHKLELLGFNVTYRRDDSSSVHTNKVLQHSRLHKGKKEHNVEALRNSNAAKNVLGEGSNSTSDSINAVQIEESADVTRQVMSQSSTSGEVNDLVKLKSKLDAVGVEFAHGESRGFRLQGARVREKEDIAFQRRQLDGRIEDDLLCLRKSGDVAGRIEYKIERLRSECLKATAREEPISYHPSRPSSRLSFIPSSVPSSNCSSSPSLRVRSKPRSGLGSRTGRGIGSASVFVKPHAHAHFPTLLKDASQGDGMGMGVGQERRYEDSGRGVQVHILTGESSPPSCSRVDDMKCVRAGRDQFRELFQIGGENIYHATALISNVSLLSSSGILLSALS